MPSPGNSMSHGTPEACGKRIAAASAGCPSGWITVRLIVATGSLRSAGSLKNARQKMKTLRVRER